MEEVMTDDAISPMTHSAEESLQEWRDEAEEWRGTLVGSDAVAILADDFDACWRDGYAAGLAANNAKAQRYRHKKRGSIYRVLAEKAEAQCATADIEEAEVVVVYQAERDGSVWVRRRAEFFDGRFELVEDAPPDTTAAGKDD
jgi:hypothetical protein